jgi:hypothetical protein
VGLGPHVIDWDVVSCSGDEEARYRVRRFPHPKSGTHAAWLMDLGPRVIDWAAWILGACRT